MSNFIPLPPTYAVTDPQVRAVLDVLSRNMQVVIDAGTSSSTNTALTPIGGASSFGSGNSSTNITNLAPAYTLDTLTADLKRGAAEVITGAVNGTTVMKLEPAGQYVVFQHKDAIILGTTGAYSGTVRTGLGITSTGILGGYNRTSDGVWQTTFAIESATGNLTLLGTIRAASVISVSAYLGSTLVSDVVNNAAAVTTKLNKSAADILSGTIDFQSAGGFKTGTIAVDGSGNATGAGVAITSKGIVGRNVGATTFTIDSVTGAATFAGALVAASGSFVGTVSAGAIITDSVTLNSAGGTSLSIIASQASGALPSASFSSTLQTNLTAGVTNILAGTGSNYRLKVDASLAFIAFQHKDAVYNGTSAAGLGILPAVGISAAGIAMGYNDNAGAWNNAVAISSAGNLTVKGTISAGSIIVGSVTIGAGGTTLTTVEGNASTALSTANTANTNANTAITNANTALTNAATALTAANAAQASANTAIAALPAKLESTSSYILTGAVGIQNTGGISVGTLTWNSTTGAITGGSGIAITEYGLVGAQSGVAKFYIDAAGNAVFGGSLSAATGTFAGSLSAAGGTFTGALSAASGTFTGTLSSVNGTFTGSLVAASGSFTGNISGGANINITGTGIFGGASSAGGYTYAVVANSGSAAQGGIISYASSTFTGAIMGYGSGNSFGVYGNQTGSQAAVQAANTVGGTGIYNAVGTMATNNSTMVTNLNANYLDGYTRAAFATSNAGLAAYSAQRLDGSAGLNVMRFVQGTVTGSAAGGFIANKPGSASNNVWIQITIDSTTLYIPVWT